MELGNKTDWENTTTFNAATTRWIEIDRTTTTNFYFACWLHGITMGGIIAISNSAWGAITWGAGDWGAQANFTHSSNRTSSSNVE